MMLMTRGPKTTLSDPGYRPRSRTGNVYAQLTRYISLASESTNSQIHLQLFHIFLICTSLFKLSISGIYLLAINDCLILAHFSTVLCVCSLLICEISLYCIDINSFSVIQVVKISQFPAYPFTFFMLSFEEPKFGNSLL